MTALTHPPLGVFFCWFDCIWEHQYTISRKNLIFHIFTTYKERGLFSLFWMGPAAMTSYPTDIAVCNLIIIIMLLTLPTNELPLSMKILLNIMSILRRFVVNETNWTCELQWNKESTMKYIAAWIRFLLPICHMNQGHWNETDIYCWISYTYIHTNRYSTL